MVTVQEIIERTFYISLWWEAYRRGLTINPEDYLVKQGDLLVPTVETERQYEEDKADIGEKFTYIFGIGNNQERGPKICPRITLELKAYYPGNIGVEKQDLELDEEQGIYRAVEYDFETKDTLIDVHLVSKTQDEMRILHDIMYRALPARGYLKPSFNALEQWKASGLGSTGNLYIEVGNYYDHPDLQHGLLEKVYTYSCVDGLLMEYQPDPEFQVVPIKDISVLIQPDGTDGINLNIP